MVSWLVALFYYDCNSMPACTTLLYVQSDPKETAGWEGQARDHEGKEQNLSVGRRGIADLIFHSSLETHCTLSSLDTLSTFCKDQLKNWRRPFYSCIAFVERGPAVTPRSMVSKCLRTYKGVPSCSRKIASL